MSGQELKEERAACKAAWDDRYNETVSFDGFGGEYWHGWQACAAQPPAAEGDVPECNGSHDYGRIEEGDAPCTVCMGSDDSSVRLTSEQRKAIEWAIGMASQHNIHNSPLRSLLAAPASSASERTEEMRDAAMRTVQAMGYVFTPGADRWKPNIEWTAEGAKGAHEDKQVSHRSAQQPGTGGLQATGEALAHRGRAGMAGPTVQRPIEDGRDISAGLLGEAAQAAWDPLPPPVQHAAYVRDDDVDGGNDARLLREAARTQRRNVLADIRQMDRRRPERS